MDLYSSAAKRGRTTDMSDDARHAVASSAMVLVWLTAALLAVL